MSEERWLEHLKFISEQQSARITINQDGCKNLLEIINKYKTTLDKIKEDIKEELENVEKDLIMMNLREKERLEWYLELLEEINE
jgi:replication initiation and membrane attachment protein DnaB